VEQDAGEGLEDCGEGGLCVASVWDGWGGGAADGVEGDVEGDEEDEGC